MISERGSGYLASGWGINGSLAKRNAGMGTEQPSGFNFGKKNQRLLIWWHVRFRFAESARNILICMMWPLGAEYNCYRKFEFQIRH